MESNGYHLLAWIDSYNAIDRRRPRFVHVARTDFSDLTHVLLERR